MYDWMLYFQILQIIINVSVCHIICKLYTSANFFRETLNILNIKKYILIYISFVYIIKINGTEMSSMNLLALQICLAFVSKFRYIGPDIESNVLPTCKVRYHLP